VVLLRSVWIQLILVQVVGWVLILMAHDRRQMLAVALGVVASTAIVTMGARRHASPLSPADRERRDFERSRSRRQRPMLIAFLLIIAALATIGALVGNTPGQRGGDGAWLEDLQRSYSRKLATPPRF
jgi:hypothetical protein